MRSFLPGVAPIDHEARSPAARLSVDSREHDVGRAAGLGEPPLVAHHRDAPRSLAPSTETGIAAEAGRLLVGADGPAFGTLLPLPPRPRIAHEPVGSCRGHVDDAFLVAQAEHATVLTHQQVGRGRRTEHQANHDHGQSGIAPASLPQAEPQTAGREQPQARTGQRRHKNRGFGPCRDMEGDGVQRIDAPAHRHQREGFQAERHQQHRQQAPRHDPEAGERHAQQVGDDAEQ